jgi:hypothetical protein
VRCESFGIRHADVIRLFSFQSASVARITPLSGHRSSEEANMLSRRVELALFYDHMNRQGSEKQMIGHFSFSTSQSA